MTSVTGRIGPQQFHEAGGIEDWRVLGEGACAHRPARVLADAEGNEACVSTTA
jgi:4a-hydroxytetrahydrobiopterin dehydratase